MKIGHVGYSPDYRSNQENYLIECMEKWGHNKNDIQEELNKMIHVYMSRNGGELEPLDGVIMVSKGEKILVRIQAEGHHGYFFHIFGA